MAESRQQLIKGSSFLRDEKEKIGGLKVKRSTITGDAFKQGTSQQIAENIDKRVVNNERKITLLKNIIKGRKENVDKKLGGGGLQSILESIATSVDSIRDTLIQRQESGEEGSDKKRIKAEQAEFDEREKDLEKKKRFEGLRKMGDRVLAPVKSLWEKIWNFIKTIFLGKILLNFLSWITNPANQKKIGSFIRFVKDWWPALLGAVVLFGTGFGAMITNLTVAIALWIPKMLGAIKTLGAIAVAGKGLAVAGGMGAWNFGRKAVSAFGATRRFNEGGIVPGSGNSDTVPAMLTPGEVVMNKGAVQQYGADTLLGMNAAAGGNNKPSFSGGKGLPGLGGGGGGTDSLTEQAKVKTWGSAIGDFLSGDDGRSRYMTDLEKSQRMAGGGLVQHFNKGGEVKKGYSEEWQQGGWATMGPDLDDPTNTRVLTSPATPFSGATYNIFNKEGDYIGASRDPAPTRKERLRLLRELRKKARKENVDKKLDATMKDGKKGNRGPLGMFSILDFMTMGITDFDKQNAVNLGEGQKDNAFKRTAGGVADWLTMGLTDFDKRGQGSLQFNPIGGGEDRKWGGDDKGKKAKKSAENISKPSGTGGGAGGVQIINATQDQQGDSQGAQGAGGDEIPAFEVGTTRDLAKARTLGIMVM